MDRRNWLLGCIAWLLGVKALPAKDVLTFKASPMRFQSDLDLKPVLRDRDGKWKTIAEIEAAKTAREEQWIRDIGAKRRDITIACKPGVGIVVAMNGRWVPLEEAAKDC